MMKSTKARFPKGPAHLWASRRVCFSNTVLFFDPFTGEEATALLHFESCVAPLYVAPAAPVVPICQMPQQEGPTLRRKQARIQRPSKEHCRERKSRIETEPRTSAQNLSFQYAKGPRKRDLQ